MSHRVPPTWPTIPSTLWPPADPKVLHDLQASLRGASNWQYDQGGLREAQNGYWLSESASELWLEISWLAGVDKST